jgi:hypothetical protein
MEITRRRQGVYYFPLEGRNSPMNLTDADVIITSVLVVLILVVVFALWLAGKRR